MTKIEVMKHHDKDVIEALMGEFYFLKKFHEDILKEEYALQKGDGHSAVAMVKKADGIIKGPLWRRERLLVKDLKKVEKDDEELESVLPESLVEELKKEEEATKTFAATLVTELSRNRGHLRGAVDDALKHAKDFEKDSGDATQ